VGSDTAKQILDRNRNLDELVFVWSSIISVSYCSDGFLHSLLNVFPGGFTNFLHCPCLLISSGVPCTLHGACYPAASSMEAAVAATD